MNVFGQQIPIRDEETGAIVGHRPSIVSRKTREPLGGQFGSDKNKRLVASFVDGDVIAIRPERTQRQLTITARDLYAYMLRCQANKSLLERAREKKARKAELRESRAVARADRKLKLQLRKEKL